MEQKTGLRKPKPFLLGTETPLVSMPGQFELREELGKGAGSCPPPDYNPLMLRAWEALKLFEAARAS